MLRKRTFFGLLLVMGLSAIVWAFSGGPPDGRAGNPPGNMTCKTSGCHNSFALNSGDGSFSIDGVPGEYTPGNTYTITVTLSDPGQKRWGFELTVLEGSNQQAGAIIVTDNTNTQLSDNMGTNPDYIKQRSAGTFAGTNDGPVSWSFDWIAPDAAAGDVTFYAAGNAANNNGTASGDYIYTTTASSSAPPPPAPTADFSAAPTSGCAPLSVDFTDLSTGEITQWDWDFGDGNSSGQQHPSHTYQDGGVYTVSLTVTGPGGSDTETKFDYITVNAAPEADFTGSPTSGPHPLTVDFTDLSTADVSGWFWDFGDEGTSTEQDPSHTYLADGTYSVTLITTGPCGSDTVTKTDYINVGTKTVDVAMTDDLVFDPDPVVIGAGQAVHWTTTGTVAHTSTSGTGPEDPQSGQLWDSGLLGTAESFTYQFESAGTYPYYCIPHFAQGMMGTVIVCDLEGGDANGDGSINVLDLVRVVNHILMTDPLDECGLWSADCNGDESINVLDLVGIVNVILGTGTCP